MPTIDFVVTPQILMISKFISLTLQQHLLMAHVFFPVLTENVATKLQM